MNLNRQSRVSSHLFKVDGFPFLLFSVHFAFLLPIRYLFSFVLFHCPVA